MPQEIKHKLIQDELRESYVDYSMSVIVGRALPDVRDGLKPVHRRILYSMHTMGLENNKPFAKCARIVGDCFKYHPHGDVAVYDALVRMAQDFSLRYPLIQGHGNFGCFTGDTKIKLLDGTSKSFKELYENYKNDEVFYVYSVNKDGNIVVGNAKNPKLTRKNAKLVEVTFDTGEKIRCTPDHRFLLKNLKYKQAKDLTPEDSLMPGYFKLSPIKGNTELNDYLMIKDNKKERYIFVHGISDNYNLNKGIYSISDGHVRHHIDFNKYNNSPDNLKRLSWKEHTKIHNDHVKTLWKNEEFRKKQSDGVKAFYKNNPEHLEKLKARIIERNKDKKFIERNTKKKREIWQSEELRRKNSDKLKKHFDEHPEKRVKMSELSKRLWSNPEKREHIINRLREAMGKKVVRKRVSDGIIKLMAENPEFIELRAKKVREFYKNNPEARKLVSKRSKKLWTNVNYRSKFVNPNYNHFSAMAKKLWQNQEYRELQIKKTKDLWDNKEFRNNIISAIKESNLERLKKDPELMNRLARKAAISLRLKWKNPGYKNKVIRSRILFYVNRLIHQIGDDNIDENSYNKHRTNNAFPRYENAIKYFNDANEMVELAKEYNHHVVSVKFLDYKEDVYDITVNEHHNFLLDCGVFVHNSIEGYSQAHMRYTEARLSKIAEEMLADINKDTVNFIPNFDGTLKEPVILPSKLPNLLVNGSAGIAVGMATNIPPHNIGEIIDAVVLMIDNKDASMDDVLNLVKGPDFPTAGLIIGKAGIRQAYQTGKGKLVIRAKTHFEKNSIIVTEIPYQINKTMLIESLADLVNNKTIEGISDIRDESDSKGMRVVIELKNNAQPDVVLNQMYKHTNLQSTFGVIMLALVDNEPRILNLKEIIQNYILHRKDVVTRRTRFDLKKAEERLHIVLGLNIALSNIDHVVRLIKESKSADAARASLMMRYSLSEIQAQAILDMRLQRLTSLEREKLIDEQLSLEKLIIELKEILASELRIFGIIKQELIELKNKYNDKRRTEIIDGEEDIETEDLIKEEDVVVTITHQGYIKQQQLEQYRQQKRGGHGIIATETKDDDFAEQIFVTSNHNYLLFFTNKGKVYWLKAYKMPSASRYSKGKAIVNLLNLEKDEKISTTLPVSHFDDKHFLIMATKKGIIKKTSLIEYSNPRKNGIAAINLREGDELIKVRLTPGTLKMLLGTKKGMAVKFDERDVRSMGRKATGVRGIRLGKGDEVIGLEVARGDATLLTITENGYGKRTAMEEYRLIRRGGKGVINIQTSERNGNVVGIKTVMDPDEIMIITKKGITIRLVANGVSVIGRNTQGVRVIRLKEVDKVASLARVNTNTNQIIKNSQ